MSFKFNRFMSDRGNNIGECSIGYAAPKYKFKNKRFINAHKLHNSTRVFLNLIAAAFSRLLDIHFNQSHIVLITALQNCAFIINFDT